jgi:hypothetical protein
MQWSTARNRPSVVVVFVYVGARRQFPQCAAHPDQLIQFIPALYIGHCRQNFSRTRLIRDLEGEYEGGSVKTQTLSSLKASIIRSPLGMNCAGNAIQAELVCAPIPPRTGSATVREEIGDPYGINRPINGTGPARLGTRFAPEFAGSVVP